MLKKVVSFLQKIFHQNFLPFTKDLFESDLLERHKKVLWALEVINIEEFLPYKCALERGRPSNYRIQIARAFVAKHVLNIPTTEMLIHHLKIDKHLRYICGWDPVQKVPHESTFSRIFKLLTEYDIPKKIHEKLIVEVLHDEVIPHASIDSMPIPVNEKVTKKKEAKRKTSKESLCYRQANEDLSAGEMLEMIPKECATGRKVKPNGNTYCWDGYKLHASIAEGKFIIGAVISSASTNDSQVAIPLSKMAASRTNVCYELMDTAYDVKAIKDWIKSQGRVPIVKEHKRRGKLNENITEERKARKYLNWVPADAVRLQLRSQCERVFARLTTSFSTTSIFVKGYEKVKTHLWLSILAHTADELWRSSG